MKMVKVGIRTCSLTFNMHCVVPENIHTPTTEGIGNSRGVGWGVHCPRKFQRGEGVNG